MRPNDIMSYSSFQDPSYKIKYKMKPYFQRVCLFRLVQGAHCVPKNIVSLKVAILCYCLRLSFLTLFLHGN